MDKNKCRWLFYRTSPKGVITKIDNKFAGWYWEWHCQDLGVF